MEIVDLKNVYYNYLNDKLNILNMVDGGVYSWKKHLKKPSKEIFDTLIKIFDLNKEEAIWIDKNYKEKGIKVGSILGEYVIPNLIERGLM